MLLRYMQNGSFTKIFMASFDHQVNQLSTNNIIPKKKDLKWESICRFSCRGEKDLVERIIAKSHQLSLTYPETFVATSRESTNLTKLYLSNAIGGALHESQLRFMFFVLSS